MPERLGGAARVGHIHWEPEHLGRHDHRTGQEGVLVEMAPESGRPDARGEEQLRCTKSIGSHDHLASSHDDVGFIAQRAQRGPHHVSVSMDQRRAHHRAEQYEAGIGTVGERRPDPVRAGFTSVPSGARAMAIGIRCGAAGPGPPPARTASRMAADMASSGKASSLTPRIACARSRSAGHDSSFTIAGTSSPNGGGVPAAQWMPMPPSFHATAAPGRPPGPLPTAPMPYKPGVRSRRVAAGVVRRAAPT